MAGKEYGLIPILAERYPDDEESYAVAIAKASDTNITLHGLRDKRSCHSGVKMAAGWVVPIVTLFDWNVIPQESCGDKSPHVGFIDTVSVGDFFDLSCAPGSSLKEYNVKGVNPFSLCDWCMGNSKHLEAFDLDFCARNHGEDFYGNIGALRCLMEGEGDVAFTNQISVFEITRERSREWASDVKEDDFVILCRDGSRKPISDYKLQGCHFHKVPSNVVMAAGNNTKGNIELYKNMLLQGQNIFGNDDNKEGFKMFASGSYFSDLIFSDVTEGLIDVGDDVSYIDWLGEDYLLLQESLTGCGLLSETVRSGVQKPLCLKTLLLMSCLFFHVFTSY
ncbi:melanotransferrin-like [Glandiceps talaboti]